MGWSSYKRKYTTIEAGHCLTMIIPSKEKSLIESVIKENMGKAVEEGSINFVFIPLSPDGSTRRFFRIMSGSISICLAVFPGSDTPSEMAEASSVYEIGSHLNAKGVAVPEIYGRDEESGLVLFEDLGDVRIHDFFLANGEDKDGLVESYQEIILKLLFMQFRGAENFDTAWCWDSTHYDVELMISRESQYFERAFLNGFVNIVSSKGLSEEFQEIALVAGSCETTCFLHRDFQSRNIMLKDKDIRFIDFQGGRIGPPGYDLASLLIDPYVGLSEDQQSKLLYYYTQNLPEFSTCNIDNFLKTFEFLALQRNLQIVGAYAFLLKERKREFFKQYIKPSLSSLHSRLKQDCFTHFPVLRNSVDDAVRILL